MSVFHLVLVVLVCLLITVFAAIFWYATYIAYVHRRYRHIPTPKQSIFFLGHLLDVKRHCRATDDAMVTAAPKPIKCSGVKLKPLFFELLTLWADELGDTYILFFLHFPVLVTRSPAALKTILSLGDQHDFPKTVIRGVRDIYGARFLGDGLVTVMDHDSWYIRRKALDPIFQKRKLKCTTELMNQSADLLIKELEHFAAEAMPIKLMDFIYKASLDVIMRTLFSKESDNLSSDFHTAVLEYAQNSFEAIQTIQTQILPEYNPFLYGYIKQVREKVSSFRNLGKNLIDSRIELIRCNSSSIPDDLLTALIQAPNCTYDIMVDEFITTVLAGMETVGNTICLLLMELGRRPDLLDRLVMEVDDVIGQQLEITNDHISSLKFTQMLIKETLRLYPPAATLMRNIKKESLLDGLMVPANTDCIILVGGCNRNKNLIDDPLVFNPDRFDENNNKIPMMAYLPFSLGARSCIGQVLAEMEMKVIIAKFVQRYSYKLDKEETYDIGQRATIYPLSELKATLYPRM